MLQRRIFIPIWIWLLSVSAVHSNCSPPDGYDIEKRGIHYKKIYNALPPIQAKQECNKDGARVAEIRSLVEFENLKEIGFSRIWLPLFRLGAPCQGKDCKGKLHWFEAPYPFESEEHLDDLEFKEKDGENCLVMKSNEDFQSLPCSNSRRFVCQFDCNNKYVKSECATNAMDSSRVYESFGQYFYMEFNDKKTFPEILRNCESRGGTLVEPISAANFLSASFALGFENAYLGFSNPYLLDCQGLDCKFYQVSDGLEANLKPWLDAGWTIKGNAKPCLQKIDRLGIVGVDCDERKVQLCQLNCSQAPQMTQHRCPSGSIVPSGFQKIMGEFVHIDIYNPAQTNEQQYARCESMNGTLGAVQTQNQFKAQQMVKSSLQQSVWVDLSNPSQNQCENVDCHGKIAGMHDNLRIHDGLPQNHGLPTYSIDSKMECVELSNPGTLTSADCSERRKAACHFRCHPPCPTPQSLPNTIERVPTTNPVYGPQSTFKLVVAIRAISLKAHS